MAESGLLPDPLVRLGIRRLLPDRLATESARSARPGRSPRSVGARDGAQRGGPRPAPRQPPALRAGTRAPCDRRKVSPQTQVFLHESFEFGARDSNRVQDAEVLEHAAATQLANSLGTDAQRLGYFSRRKRPRRQFTIRSLRVQQGYSEGPRLRRSGCVKTSCETVRISLPVRRGWLRRCAART
jgi:hypothetical protein